MTDIFAVDPNRDLPRQRIIEVPDEPAFKIVQQDPHGFWIVQRERGQIPEQLKGQYTTVIYARQAVEGYIRSQKEKEKAKK